MLITLLLACQLTLALLYLLEILLLLIDDLFLVHLQLLIFLSNQGLLLIYLDRQGSILLLQLLHRLL